MDLTNLVVFDQAHYFSRTTFVLVIGDGEEKGVVLKS
jgi:hypothetical protein